MYQETFELNCLRTSLGFDGTFVVGVRGVEKLARMTH